jgi:carbon-monoxide dehydrogenase medium subunit
MLSKAFAFHAPRDLEHALELLRGNEGDTKLLAGGMSLMPAMNLGLARPDTVISLNHMTGLDFIEETDSTIRIGAMVRHERIESDPLIARHCALLGAAAAAIGDVQIRHRGTIGGSAAHADPAADYLPVLVATGATIVVASASGRRRVPASEFFVDIMRTALALDEFVVAVEIPKLADGSGCSYVRLSRIEGSFAIVNSAATVSNGDGIIAIGGATGRPVTIAVEANGRPGQIEDAAEAACQDAFGDLRASSDYRRAVARVYARRAFEAAVANQN